jgi:transcriptional regulator with XRE-family HTH domain
MALFFDKDWFDARLAAAGLSRAQLAAKLGLEEMQVAEIWKDQRELTGREVATLASLLNVTPEEIALRAGVSTPLPPNTPKDLESIGHALADLAARLERLERAMVEIKSLLLDIRRQSP